MNKVANTNQIEIAQKLGIDVSGDSERVAAALIEDYVFYAIYPGREKLEPSEKQIEFAKSLGIKIKSDSILIISAQITDELEKQNIEAINNFGLSASDEVTINEHGYVCSYTISSIAKNYRLWFKGGNGRGAWPTQIIAKVNHG
jgi:hypothetical protein